MGCMMRVRVRGGQRDEQTDESCYLNEEGEGTGVREVVGRGGVREVVQYVRRG